MQRSTGMALVAACLMLLALPGSTNAASRSLLQDALSNSNGCIDSGVIPKCEQGACATRNIMGQAKWVCLRCLANYDPVVSADGQDNIIQCVCPRGTFENGTNAQSCTRCPPGSYCPGGDRAENPTTRGAPVTCGSQLVTRQDGARSPADCVAPAGYALTSPNTATACAASTYAPNFNRLSRCLRCQSGLEENPALSMTVSQRSNRKAVCKLPPGRFMSQGLVRICPQGFYRENYVDMDDPAGVVCTPCNPGITTDGAGAGNRAQCNRVLAGYGISNQTGVTDPTNVAQVPALPAGQLPAASVCPIAFYSYNGRCVNCPRGTVTTVAGAKSVEECVVPPGYMLAAAPAVMAACPAGTFREGWAQASSAAAAVCTPCGDGIDSEARDLNVNPLVANGTLARSTSSSCYINAGWGLIAQGRNTWAAYGCPVNTYGASDKVHGLTAAPCKPCPRNMITDGQVRVNNSDVCINDDGFGYASEGASRCAPGFYSAKGSRRPCQQCPSGRTTTDVASQQRVVGNCLVRPGCGIVDSSRNGTDAFNPNVTGLDNTTLAAVPVLECPAGFFSAGGALDTKCTPCPAGSSTAETGSTSVAQCSVCLPGFGIQPPGTACTPCAYGFFHQGGATVCTSCPTTTFYGPVDNATAAFTSDGITVFTGARSPDTCVPRVSQLSPEAGQAYYAPGAAVASLFTTSSAASISACLATCNAALAQGRACMAQYTATGACSVSNLTLAVMDTASGTQLAIKLPPSALSAASSVKAKTLASGFYAYIDATSTKALWEASGTNATGSGFARTASYTPNASRVQCEQACDASNVCWGFLYDAAARACMLRGGVDALNGRAAFALPAPATTIPAWNNTVTANMALESLRW